MCIEKLDNIVNESNNIYNYTVKMRSFDVQSSTYIDSRNKDAKFKIRDLVKISKYNNIFSKGYVTNLSEEIFVNEKDKNTVPWVYVISDLKGE